MVLTAIGRWCWERSWEFVDFTVSKCSFGEFNQQLTVTTPGRVEKRSQAFSLGKTNKNGTRWMDESTPGMGWWPGWARQGKGPSWGHLGGFEPSYGGNLKIYHSLKLTAKDSKSSWKWMVGILSFLDGLFFQGRTVSFRECMTFSSKNPK